MKLLIKSATIIDPSSPFHNKKQDILIENGKISKISKSIENPNTYKEIRLEKLHISQGWCDTRVWFGEPGFEERETIENGLNTAAKSGFTDVAVNANTYPVADNKSAIEFIKNKAETLYHPSGTCKMGFDQNAVVDKNLKVHGIKGLRVADASIMPTLVSGNTNAVCMMIGERCADFIINS
mgnify:CR=1 FL=1